MTWIPSHSGAPLELLDPRPEQVDFSDVAWALATTNRFNGRAQSPVSVGLHALIGLDIARPGLRPLWLARAAKHAFTGAVGRAHQEAILALALRRHGPDGADLVAAVLAEFEAAHEVAVHRAADLALPSAEQRVALNQVDLVCEATERRAFLGPQQRRWPIDEWGVEPDAKGRRWMPHDRVADALTVAFRRHLPALQGRSLRAIA